MEGCKNAIIQLLFRLKVDVELVKIILLSFYNRLYFITDAKDPRRNIEYRFYPLEMEAIARKWPKEQDFPEVLVAMLFKCPGLTLSSVHQVVLALQTQTIKPTTMFKFINMLGNELDGFLKGNKATSSACALALMSAVKPIAQQLYMDVNTPAVYFDAESPLYSPQSDDFDDLGCHIIPYNARVLSIMLTLLTHSSKVGVVNSLLHKVGTAQHRSSSASSPSSIRSTKLRFTTRCKCWQWSQSKRT